MAGHSPGTVSKAADALHVGFDIADAAHAPDALTIATAVEEAFTTVFARFPPLQGTRLVVAAPRLPGERRDATSPWFTILYPDRSPAVVSYVEPSAPPRGIPRMRLKHRSSDARLLGDGTTMGTLIPHELAHAVHFALMPVRWRMWIEARYATWIAGEVARGGDARHDVHLATSPLVAWLEAFGIFAERFWLFARRHPRLSGTALDEAFLRGEQQTVRNWSLPTATTPGPTHGKDVNVEGAVYRLVFVEYARRTSLATAVSLYLRSGTRGIRSYAGFAAALASAPVPPPSAGT